MTDTHSRVIRAGLSDEFRAFPQNKFRYRSATTACLCASVRAGNQEISAPLPTECLKHPECEVNLPLLDNARNGSIPATVLDLPDGPYPPSGKGICSAGSQMPERVPGAGEQYRFHFDMTKCIGCQCCVVACNEQNGNPASIRWRRVGEIEGGTWPDTLRLYLSMGCNHCLEPTCMEGCPVDAYTKDPLTGIVLHSAELCIGCQYCTWNCSYGVPQYNPERGVVGKCDMCYGRLAEGLAPACVNACPEEAIRIEVVNIDAWRAEYAAAANAPGLPSADDSLSTTRLTLPKRLPRDTARADEFRVRPEQPHWPLVFMTVLTQMSIAAFCSLVFEQAARGVVAGSGALAALAVAAIALLSSTLHLGRPAYAWRAVRMWRRSWLSREVLLFTVFAGLGTLYAVALWRGGSIAMLFGAASSAAGLCALYASARLYMVPARPAWNSGHTVAEFYLSGALTGPTFAALFLSHARRELLLFAAAAAACALLQQIVRLLWIAGSDVFELGASAGLLSSTLRAWLLLRAAGLIAVGLVLTRPAPGIASASLALTIALAVEFVGRWLFFVSVVPKNMAAGYLYAQEAA